MGKKTSGKNQLRSEAEVCLAGSLPAKTPARSAEEIIAIGYEHAQRQLSGRGVELV